MAIWKLVDLGFPIFEFVSNLLGLMRALDPATEAFDSLPVPDSLKDEVFKPSLRYCDWARSIGVCLFYSNCVSINDTCSLDIKQLFII